MVEAYVAKVTKVHVWLVEVNVYVAYGMLLATK